ncbi:hypothetical protein AVEN_99509-1 [Araneus ventricosus]|uniref:Uncharacterized protein n=1 Tax=Araneus ventricosus TaxID=182803 RepID=A0A4Y2QQD2_ARAVE|nr:hypothetical protein AVEN_99509-1 [Araneus ventricosus]
MSSGDGGIVYSVKLSIHGRTVPRHLERVAPNLSSCQPIHLDGLFMEVPYKRHYGSLQSVCQVCYSSRFQNGLPRPAFPRDLHSPPPYCGFRFCERGSHPLTDRISVLRTSALNEKRDWMKIQAFHPTVPILIIFWH